MAPRFDDDERNPFAAPRSDIAPEEYASAGGPVEYGSFLSRFGAAIVDGIIMFIINFSIGFVIALAVVRDGVIPAGLELGLNIMGFIIQWIYFAAQESSESGATLGKKAAGLRVTDEMGNRISFGRATGRYFAKILSAVILLIGYLMQPFTKRKQALHDILAGTLVVKS